MPPSDTESSDTDPDSWFRPVWDDPTEEADAAVLFPGAPGFRRSSASSPLPPLAPLLAPLCAAQDALARLDARLEAAAEPVREGVIARLAFREAAGFLAAHQAWVHPRDLALRELDLTGPFDAAVKAGAAETALPNTLAEAETAWSEPDGFTSLVLHEAAVPAALHLARLLRRLPRRHDPLADAASAASLLVPLGRDPTGAFDAVRFARWRAGLPSMSARAHRRPGISPSPPLPPLLLAAMAARDWMQAGVTDRPTAAQALAVAAVLLARSETARLVPLPVWGAWPAIGQPAPEDGSGLPRLRAGMAQRLSGGDGESWEGSFLHLVTEGARAGLRELDRLLQAAAIGADLTVKLDRRARLADAADLALRVPALTPKALARRLRITHQAATRLLGRLAEAGVVTEVTGRRSFRAFAAGAG